MAERWSAWTEPAAKAAAEWGPEWGATADERAAVARRGARMLRPFAEALGVSLDETWLAAFASWVRPVRGGLNLWDALTLGLFVRTLRPARIAELGVAGGHSSAVMLRALAEAGIAPADATGQPRIWGYDIARTCFFDGATPVGFAVRELVPELASGHRLATGDVRLAAAELEGAGLKFALIDASHAHPWATFDLLWLSRALAPGAWVVLHDVSLARIIAHREERAGRPGVRMEYGAEVLFDRWPGTKAVGLGWAGNIGAIRVEDPAGLSAVASDVLASERWETDPGAEITAIAGSARRAA
ncbi:MAG: class I SAM-dependent methyltransferase [Phycisphaerales bacterium]|nr:class I SAM-dependent methyltransferase [Phycisphaerales bacterium]